MVTLLLSSVILLCNQTDSDHKKFLFKIHAKSFVDCCFIPGSIPIEFERALRVRWLRRWIYLKSFFLLSFIPHLFLLCIWRSNMRCRVLFLCRFAILAGDADPMDVVSHLPIFFEENHVPYTWVPTRRVSSWNVMHNYYDDFITPHVVKFMSESVWAPTSYDSKWLFLTSWKVFCQFEYRWVYLCQPRSSYTNQDSLQFKNVVKPKIMQKIWMVKSEINQITP